MRNSILHLTQWSVVLVAAFSPSLMHAQVDPPRTWRTFTSMRNVRSVAVAIDSTHGWVATNGGVFRFNLIDSTEPLFPLRTTDGLSTNTITAVASDRAGNIIFGGATGSVDIYSPANGSVTKVNDILAFPDFTQKQINDIYAENDTVYFATGYGISIYKNAIPHGAFLTTVRRIGLLPALDSVSKIITSNGRIYALLKEGLAFASKHAQLTNNNVWTVAATDSTPMSLTEFHGRLYVATLKSLSVLNADTLRFVTLANVSLRQLAANSDSLFALSNDGSTIYSSADGINFSSVRITLDSVNSPLTTIALGLHNRLVLGSQNNGARVISSTGDRKNIYPDGPVSNQLVDLNFSQRDRKLYTANGNLGSSIYDRSSGAWVSFTPSIGGFPQKTCSHVLYDSVRSIAWYSTRGDFPLFAGRNMLGPNPSFRSYNITQGIPSTFPNFYIGGKGMLDRDGNFAITTWALNGRGLSITKDGNTFTSLPLEPGMLRPFGSVTQDQDGNYWVGTQENTDPSPIGVFYVRPSDSLNGLVAGGSTNPITDPNVNALLVDQDNGVWIGTDKGVQVLSNPYAIAQSNPSFSIRAIPLLSQQIVHAMVTDGVGNKWIGTDNGVFVVSQDGSDSLGHYTTANSPLVDDHVSAIAIDLTAGEVYFGTPSGMSRLSTVFLQGHSDFSSMLIYPNPIVEDDESAPTVYISGLVSGSTLKIFTLSGKLIQSIDATQLGSTATWNGRDGAGRLLPSGIYLISATSAQSSGAGQTKFVVVRKHS